MICGVCFEFDANNALAEYFRIGRKKKLKQLGLPAQVYRRMRGIVEMVESVRGAFLAFLGRRRLRVGAHTFSSLFDD